MNSCLHQYPTIENTMQIAHKLIMTTIEITYKHKSFSSKIRDCIEYLENYFFETSLNYYFSKFEMLFKTKQTILH